MRGQIAGLAIFVMVLLGMIIVAPIILKVAVTMLDTTSTQLSNIQPSNQSSDDVVFVKNKITGSLDWAIMLLVLINILVLLITSFLIDIHPAFLVIYIIGAFLLVITLPYTAAAGERIYGMAQFSQGTNNVIQYIPMTEFMLNHFGVIIVGVLFLTGIIMYAKIKFSSQNAGGTSY